MKLVFGALAMALAMWDQQSAAYYCSTPAAPSCAQRYGSFDDEDDFDRCKRQMTSYRYEVETYLSCVKTESESALSTYNSAV